MPLLKRKTVPVLPLPPEIVNNSIPPGQGVFYLEATGDIFVDYESYATRISYLMQRIFQCAISGKRDLDYFAALLSETQTSSKTSSRFPEELVPHVLRSCQFQVEGRLDGLIERVNERFHNRFFKGEKLFIEIQGDKYLCRVTRIHPPLKIRAQSGTDNDPQQAPYDDSHAHRIGTDLDVPIDEANELDPASEYLYTVQLLDQQNNFEGSFMEVRNTQLGRDRLHYSKSMLKRLLRDSLVRDAQIAKPWVVRSNLAEKYDIPSAPPDEVAEKNEKIRVGKLAKRKRPPKEGSAAPGGGDDKSKKRTKREDAEKEKERLKQQREKEREARKPIKYPIEDLDLDPMTIHDGRVLRRVLTEVPPLPPKADPSRDLPIPSKYFESFLMNWAMLNIFGLPLGLSNFTLDEFEGALTHDTIDPRCILLAEIHGSLINIISSENLRIYGTLQATATSPISVPPDSSDSDDNNTNTSLELRNFFVRKGLEYSRGWDREAKLKAAEGREGWERHLIGVLCQRGGIETMPDLPIILQHLLYGDEEVNLPSKPSSEANGENEEEEEENGDEKEENENEKEKEEGDEDDEDDESDEKQKDEISPTSEEFEEESSLVPVKNPEDQYLTLSLANKLRILSFLCELALASKHVRGYIEDCEVELTDLRKERVEINKEKRLLLAEKQSLTEKTEKKPSSKENGKKSDQETETNGHANNSKNSNNISKIDDGDNMSNRQTVSPPAVDVNSNGDPDDVDESMMVDQTVDDIKSPEDDGDGADQLEEMPASERSHQHTEGVENDHGSDSEFDELESNHDGLENGATTYLNPASRRATLQEKRLKREAEAAERARAIEARQTADKAEKDLKKRIKINDEEYQKLCKRGEELEREFRKYRDVARIRPLGKDRFFNRYFYFDGVGTMPLVAQGGHPIYWTGRLYVQGPSAEDWEVVCSQRGKDEMAQRRIREEGESIMLKIGEWGFYDDDDQIETLLNWLNSKGLRENHLKGNLKMWRHFIVGGAKRRKNDIDALQNSVSEARRSTRAAAMNAHYFSRRYMSYNNRFAKQ